jgi:3'-5' exonuclease
MLKGIKDTVWAYDLEWAPDPRAGRVLYGLDAAMDDATVVAHMWKEGGATEEDPTPYLKTIQCRVVSIAAVERRAAGGETKLNLLYLPRDPADPAQASEREMIQRFLAGAGKRKPQMVGFNSLHADLKVLLQRGVVCGVTAPEFCRRPDKPWEGVDYFAKGGDWQVDLMEIFGSWGKGALSLHEIATLSGIPGKFGTAGDDVARLWLTGQWKQIVEYNCFDALTTYLLWLRTAFFSGHFTAEAYAEEQELVRQLIMDESEKEGGDYLTAYFDEWERLQAATGQLG